MSAADKGGKSKPRKAEKQKRVCQKFMTHPLFYFFKDLSSQIFTSYETYFSKACKS